MASSRSAGSTTRILSRHLTHMRDSYALTMVPREGVEELSRQNRTLTEQLYASRDHISQMKVCASPVWADSTFLPLPCHPRTSTHGR